MVPYAENAEKSFIFLDDNVRPHRARVVKQLQENHGIQRMDWTLMSSDLIPIMHFWDTMGRFIEDLEANVQELQQLSVDLENVWDALNVREISSLTNCKRQCREAFIAAGAGHSLQWVSWKTFRPKHLRNWVRLFTNYPLQVAQHCEKSYGTTTTNHVYIDFGATESMQESCITVFSAVECLIRKNCRKKENWSKIFLCYVWQLVLL